MGETFRVGDNLFVIPVDMENRLVEDIAREAVIRIAEFCEEVGRGREANKKEGD